MPLIIISETYFQFDSTKHCRFSGVVQFSPVVTLDKLRYGSSWTSRENSLELIQLSIVVQGPNDCEFEADANGLCLWTQDDSDQINWIRNQGPTPSTSTGPVGDHTSGGGKPFFRVPTYLHVST